MVYKAWRGEKLTPEQYEEVRDLGEFFDAGDWTTKELKKHFPKTWPVFDKWRKEVHEHAPDYYRSVIERQKKDEDNNEI